MDNRLLIAVGILVVLCVYFLWRGGVLPAPYNSRSCCGNNWKKAFPDRKSEEIRQFLSLFTSAFSFKSEYRLKFMPTDRVMDIYQSLYPVRGVDAMELETLKKNIESVYQLDFDRIWSERLTLGELFAYVSENYIKLSK